MVGRRIDKAVRVHPVITRLLKVGNRVKLKSCSGIHIITRLNIGAGEMYLMRNGYIKLRDISDIKEVV